MHLFLSILLNSNNFYILHIDINHKRYILYIVNVSGLIDL